MEDERKQEKDERRKKRSKKMEQGIKKLEMRENGKNVRGLFRDKK